MALTWTVGAAAPSNYPTGVTAAAIGTRIYVMGGNEPSGRAFCYESATDTWSEIAPIPTPCKYGAAAAVDGKIYHIGGLTVGGAGIATIYAYDPATNTWGTVFTMPTMRFGHNAVTVDNSIHIVSGSAATHYRYTPSTNTFEALTSMPARRQYSAATVFNGGIYVVGGQPDTGTYDKVERYDIASKVWETRPKLTYENYAFGAAAVSDRIIAAGGYSNRTRVQAIAPDGTVTQETPLANNGAGSTTVSIGNDVFVIGGDTTPLRVQRTSVATAPPPSPLGGWGAIPI